MSLLTTQGIRVLQVLVAATVVLTLFFTLSHFGSETIHDGAKSVTDRFRGSENSNLQSSLPFSSSKAPEPSPANSTLDFQEIIYLSMPYRTDRQDAMSLIAAVAGIKLTMLPGVTADSIHPKAMPPHVGTNNMTGTPALGIWRAHANVWKYILDNDIQSALILEDDVDFDVNIKDIMGNLNWQLRYNNTIRWGRDNVQKGWDEKCPYGCDWDELFVGQCGGKPNKKRLDLHQIVPDPNTPQLSEHKPWVHREFNNLWNLTDTENIRVISPTYQPLCLQAYGLSRMGAMRMLYQIGGWKAFGYPVDNEIAWRTAEGVLSGYTMSPPAFNTWRVGGAQDSDNDAVMGAKEVQTKGNEAGSSFGLKKSVRKHLKEFFEKNYWKDMENEVR